jgi:hypothetical protein
MQKLGPEDIKGMVRKVLSKAFSDSPKKQIIYSSQNRLNFSCPYCRDSDDPKKKRGNLYLDSLSFKCYNGGCGIFRDFIGFLRDYKLVSDLTIDQIEEAKVTIEAKKPSKRSFSGSVDFFLLDNYRDIIIDRNFYRDKLNLIELPGTLTRYLESRNQTADERYLYAPDKKSLHILNLTSDKKYIIGLQMRNMNKWATNKYFTYKLSGIYRNLFKENKPEVISKAEQIDPISNVFGFSTVDLDQTITIFEGPLDSFLFPNSIGLCSINNQFPFDISNRRWFFDYDEPGRDALRKKLSDGESVFLWSKFLEENQIPLRDKWDLNDIVNYLRSTGKKIKPFREYFSNSIWDMILV